jgi:hypothetical protein
MKLNSACFKSNFKIVDITGLTLHKFKEFSLAFRA